MEFHNRETLGSDRLRKAIERNRAKKARKSSSSTLGNWGDLKEPSSSTSGRRSSTPSQARKSVTSVEDIEFSKTLRKPPKKAPAVVNYSSASASAPARPTRPRVPSTTTRATATRAATTRSTTTRTTRKRATKSHSKWNEYLVKGAWVFSGFLILRLIFSTGGMIDFFESKSFLSDHYYELSRIKNENEALVEEIKKLSLNNSYQKKMVRDHLGYISKEEYLIMFAKSAGPSK